MRVAGFEVRVAGFGVQLQVGGLQVLLLLYAVAFIFCVWLMWMGWFGFCEVGAQWLKGVKWFIFSGLS